MESRFDQDLSKLPRLSPKPSTPEEKASRAQFCADAKLGFPSPADEKEYQDDLFERMKLWEKSPAMKPEPKLTLISNPSSPIKPRVEATSFVHPDGFICLTFRPRRSPDLRVVDEVNPILPDRTPRF